MATVTDTLIRQRAAKSAAVKTGQWHADFSTVKKYSDSKKVPILAVWSNGDSCGHCIHFEQCLLNSKFKTWAKTSGVAMWIGFSKDKSAEDKFEGTGFKFSRKNTLRAYPFVRLYWKSGKVDICKSGDDWTGANTTAAKGAEKLVKALKTALKSYKPTCDGCSDASSVSSPTAQVTTPVEKAPMLSYRKNDACGGYSLVVDGEDATCLTEEVAKKVCEAYSKAISAS